MDLWDVNESHPAPGSPARAPSASEQQQLRTAARDFEALFIETLLRAMRSTVIESDLLDSSGQVKYYRQLYDEELSHQVAGGGSGLGLVELIMQQLSATSDAEASGRQPALLPNQTAGGDQTADQRATPPARVAPTTVGPVLPNRELNAALDLVRLHDRARSVSQSVADSLARFEREISDAAAQTGTDPALLLSVLTAESGGDPQARSPRGAQGLMQLMPATAAELGLQQPWQPADNLLGGAQYLASLRARFGQRLDLALAAYNAGPGAVQRAGGAVPPYPETERYVQKVLDLYEKLGTGDHNQPQASAAGSPQPVNPNEGQGHER